MDAQTADIVIKVLVAVIGAIAGVLGKTLTDVYRVRALMPIVLDQVKQTATLCSAAFSIGDAKAASNFCDAAFKGVSELVALGVRPRRRWGTGAQALLRTSVQIGTAISAEGNSTIAAMDGVRRRGFELQTWLDQLKPRKQNINPSVASKNNAA